MASAMTQAHSEPPELARLANLSGMAPWVLVVRLKTLGLSLAPVLAGSWVAATEGYFRLGVLIAASLSAAAIQIGANLWNDTGDAARGADGPDRVGPPRMTGLGLLPARHVRSAAMAAFLSAALFGLYLVAIGGWPIIVIGLVSLAMGYLYSMGPYPLSGSPLGELLVITFFGIVAVAGTAHLHGAPLDGGVVLLGVIIGLPAAAVLLVNNHRDRRADALVGRRTLAILIGVSASRILYVGLLSTSIVAAFLMDQRCMPGALVFLPPAALVAWLGWRMSVLPVAAALNRLIVGTAAYQALLLVSLVLAPALCSPGGAVP